ncbi:MAG: hypothetical protein GX557_16650, partial [Chloroflexi bacterium]|nr:hypothetical protein [Chloroflexota bacterium]
MMPRQSGKNETAAHVEALLLNACRRVGGCLVKAAPTFQPQALISLQRLEALLRRAPGAAAVRERGNTLRLDRARALFCSAAPGANVVGATANILLEADEAQDIDEDKWNKDFAPMGASANVTTVLWGTAWTGDTLLARTLRRLREAEVRDGVRRVFTVAWQEVAAEVPAYGRYVRGEIARLGRDHPLIRTQYGLEELTGAGGMFAAEVQAAMRGTHPRLQGPAPGGEYALLVDVAGGSEERLPDAQLRAEQPRKDSTAVTVVELTRDAQGWPTFRVVDRRYWTGRPQPELFGALTALAEHWAAARLVVDATGLGAGLAAFLQRALGERVLPWVFTARSKSDLGWRFLGLCGAGRFRDHADDGSPERHQFWREVAAADLQVLPGPGKLLRWGVSDPSVHDDLLVSAALCAALEDESGAPSVGSHVVEAED